MAYLRSAVALIIQLYSFLIIARALLGFTGIDPYHPVARFLYRVTEPVLQPIRRIMPRTGMLDFSPLVALILLTILGRIVLDLLR